MKHIVSLCLFALVCGCATSFEELGSKIDNTLKTNSSKKQSSYSLTVQAEPSDSTIKIMNIKPKYRDGIILRAGTYDILVQKEGYASYRKYIKISNQDVIKQVTLKPVTPSVNQNVAISTPKSVETPKQKQDSSNSRFSIEQGSTVQTTKKPRTRTVQKVETKTTATPQPKKVEKVAQAKEKLPVSDNTKRADYFPQELAKASKLEPADMTKDEQPKFNGAYIKTVDKGFFSDTVELIEMKQILAYNSVIFKAKASEKIGITWLLKQNKKYFAFDLSGTITLPIEKFQGVIAKGESTEFISLHPVEKWVRGFDKDGLKKGETVTFFNSSKHVDHGQQVFLPGAHSKVNMAKINNDSHFIDFKNKPKKGLYVIWIAESFWFFNLI